MKKFLMSASMIAVLSTQVLATQRIVNQEVDQNLGRTQILQLLRDSNDLTFSINEGAIANRALQRAVTTIGGRLADADQVPQYTRDRINYRLNDAKTSHAPLPHDNKYRLSENLSHDLSVESDYNILVYPIDQSRRNNYRNFLPTSYVEDDILGDALRQTIDQYSQSIGLSQENTERLRNNLKPVFFIIQDQIILMRDGDANRNIRGIKGLPRWVYEKGYQGILESIKDQTEHHLKIIRHAQPIFDETLRNTIKNNLPDALLKTGLSLLHDPRIRVIYGNNYTLGVNRRQELCLIHPSNGLPYPVLSDQRSKVEEDGVFPRGDMNLPDNYVNTPFLQKQWNRAREFVRLSEQMTLNEHDQRRAKVLLEPVVYMARDLLKDMQSDFSRLSFTDLMDFSLISFDDQQQKNFFNNFAPRLLLNHQNIDRDLKNLKENKIDTHAYLTGDLWPSRFSSKPAQVDFSERLVNYLLYQELKDRLTSSWPERKNLLLQQEREKDQSLHLTQERLLSRENDINQIQTRLTQSEEELQNQIRLAKQKEEKLLTQIDLAKEDVEKTTHQFNAARAEQQKKEALLREEMNRAEQKIRLAQKQEEESRMKQKELEQALIEEGKNKEEALRLAQEKLGEEREQAEIKLRLVQEEANKQIEFQKELVRAAQRLADAAELRAAKAEEGLAEALKLVDQTQKELKIAERDRQLMTHKMDDQSNEIALLRQSIVDTEKNMLKQFTDFENKITKVHVTQLDEANRALKYRTEQYEQLTAFRLSEAMNAHKNIGQLDQKLEIAEGRLKNAEILLLQQKEASRLAQEEADNKYALLQKAKEDEFETLDQLYKAAKSEAEKLSEVVVKLTAELEDIRYEQAEILSLYEQAKFQVKEATVRYEKAEEELKALADLSSISLPSSLNNSPFEKDNIGIIKQVNLMGLENMLVHEEQFKNNPNILNPFSGQFPINFGGMNQTVHSNSMNEGMGIKPFKKWEDMTVYQSEYGYNDSKGFHPFDDSKSFVESKLIDQSVLKENPQIKEQIEKESEDMIDLSSLHIHDKSKNKSESESFVVMDKSNL